MTCGIYIIRNEQTRKVYVGSSLNIEKRFQTHRSELRGRRHGNPHLQSSWNKYGEDCFEFFVFQSCIASERRQMEQELVSQIIRDYGHKLLYNNKLAVALGCKSRSYKPSILRPRITDYVKNYDDYNEWIETYKSDPDFPTNNWDRVTLWWDIRFLEWCAKTGHDPELVRQALNPPIKTA